MDNALWILTKQNITLVVFLLVIDIGILSSFVVYSIIFKIASVRGVLGHIGGSTFGVIITTILSTMLTLIVQTATEIPSFETLRFPSSLLAPFPAF